MIVDHLLSKDGMPVIRIEEATKIKHLGSIYNRKREIDSWLQKYSQIKDFAIIVIFGLADGEMLKQLMNMLPSNVVVLIYEPSLDIYEYVNKNFDLSEINNDRRVNVFVKGLNENLFSEKLWELMDDSNYMISMIDAIPGYSNIFSEDFNYIKNTFEIRIEHCKSDILSAAAHGSLETENLINNLKYIDDCRCIDQLIGLIPTHLPVIIVSAGPSLRRNGEYLKHLKNHLCIIAVDTAVPYMLSIGVFPDLIITVSPVKDVSLYEDKRLSDIPIAIDPIVTYKGLEKIDQGYFIFISASNYYEKIFAFANHSIEELESGGNVSSTAFSFAVLLGFKEIIMVGLDLALEEDVMYSGVDNNEEVMKLPRIAVDGYYGNVVYTLPNYKVFLDWFNVVIEKKQEIQVFNATEGGANIKGCINISLKEIAEKYSEEKYDYETIIKTMPKAITDNSKELIYSYLEEAPARIRNLSDKLTNGIEFVDLSMDLMEGGKKYNSEEIRNLYIQIKNIIEDCALTDENEFIEKIASEKNSNILEDINIGGDDPNLEYIRMLEKLRQYFVDMKTASYEVEILFQKLLERKKDRSIYKKNIEICNNYMTKRLEDVCRNSNDSFLLPNTELAKDGTLITYINYDNNKRYLNSSYAPIKEADRFAQKFNNINRYGILLIFGFSNGIIARRIISLVPDHVKVLFYEPSLELFIHTIKHFDITDILNNKRACIFVKGLNDVVFDTVIGGMINVANYKYTYYDVLPGYKGIFGDDFELVYSKYESLIQTERNNIETDKLCGREEAVNNIYNLKLLSASNCEEQFRGKFPTDLPVVIAASGPSLKKNVKELRRLKNKLLIIAVENVVRFLIDNGVRPDIAVIVDPIITSDVITGLENENIIYAYGTGSSYKFMEQTGDGRKIAITTRAAYYEKIFELADHHLYALNSAGSVANIAFSLAQVWGYSKFILVGQDLAYDGEIRYADDKINKNYNDLRMYDVPGYSGGIVHTSMDFKSYLEWYEMMISTHPEFEVTNSTEGGAKIQGALQRPLSEIADEYQEINIDYEKIILDQPCVFKANEIMQLKEYIKQSVENISSMYELLKHGIDLIDINLIELAEKNLKADFKDNNRMISKIMSDCADYLESYFVDGLIADRNADTLSDIFDESSDPYEEYCRMLEKTKEYANDMAVACETVKQMFLEVLESI